MRPRYAPLRAAVSKLVQRVAPLQPRQPSSASEKMSGTRWPFGPPCCAGQSEGAGRTERPARLRQRLQASAHHPERSLGASGRRRKVHSSPSEGLSPCPGPAQERRALAAGARAPRSSAQSADSRHAWVTLAISEEAFAKDMNTLAQAVQTQLLVPLARQRPNTSLNRTRNGVPRLGLISFWPRRVTPLRAG